MSIFKNILKFIKNPKNTRIIFLGLIAIFILLFLHQCNKASDWKNQVELQKQETQRVANNYEAFLDTIKQKKIDENTWRAEKLGYEITVNELKGKYNNLLGDFELEKNKPPKAIINTEYIIRDVITNVPVYINTDNLGNTSLIFSDSTHHNLSNFRFLKGNIPYKIVLDTKDSLYKIVPGFGEFDLTLGMNLNLGLFQDKKTKKITILADTDYPGVTFTTLNGASIMDDPKNKKVLRSLRKTWGIGLSIGYGAFANTKNGLISSGPYIGIGLNYSPKFLQWGK